MTVVYLSGPMSQGDRSHNAFLFLRAHETLMDRGYAVINPGLTYFLPWAGTKPHAAWIAADLPIVERCDLVVRLPGESVGADMEVEHAKKHGIPVLFIEHLYDLEKLASGNHSAN